MKKVILICGPAGIGKSTLSKKYAAEHTDEKVYVIAADDCRCEICGAYNKFPKGGNMLPVYDLMVEKAKKIAEKENDVTVIFDTTSLTDQRRLFYVNKLEGIFDRFEIIMCRLHDYKKCLERNARRPKDRLVPEEVIISMIEHYDEPSEETLKHFDAKADIYLD